MCASDRSVSIMIPTRNEVDNIAPLVSQIVAAAAPFHEIIFVDGRSTDGTIERIRSLSKTHPIRLMEQDPATPGLSAAILAAAAATNSELLVVMDAMCGFLQSHHDLFWKSRRQRLDSRSFLKSLSVPSYL